MSFSALDVRETVHSSPSPLKVLAHEAVQQEEKLRSPVQEEVEQVDTSVPDKPDLRRKY